MSAALFNEWVHLINEIMKKDGRKILLIMDNEPVHKPFEFSKIQIEFISPNTSALIQPLDMGIIKILNDWYTRKLSNFLIAHIDQVCLVTLKN